VRECKSGPREQGAKRITQLEHSHAHMRTTNEGRKVRRWLRERTKQLRLQPFLSEGEKKVEGNERMGEKG
jgi:hypothetical protein